ncbi:RNA polymerase sigma-70 factor [Streptomyces sp. NPDC057386]|jgi:RNA polymerase sigma-70 factor (ECF subfamily)|uniref:RNA polymerase sigma-70 factor n=1 Tax=Streptomyces thermocoprophilus TaxID=78356 RepID=A0ABV5VD80_9ACTN
MTTTVADDFETHRPRLFGLAYRMLGSAHEAEDVVQDAYLRYSGADRAEIGQLGAWLAKVVTNLCLNRLTSARVRRETYVGPWLPEPVVTADGTLGPLESAEQREAVSLALLVLLERLTPTERAVYVLREAFGYAHREIAQLLELTEANCRQLHRRAVKRISAEETRFTPTPERQRRLVTSFLGAARDGDLAGLEKLLAQDVVWSSDGGGKVRTALRPVLGREKVLRFLAGLAQKYGPTWELAEAEINGEPGVLVHADGALIAVIAFEYREDRIVHARAVMSPEKLDFARRQLSAQDDD